MESKLVYEPGKIPGLKIRLGSLEYIVPPLSLAGVEQHEEKIEQIKVKNGQLNIHEQTGLICEVILTAMQRNYPEMKIEQLKEVIDLGNVQEIFMAILGQSGYKLSEKGEKESV